jgi:hypothetical protein
MHHLAPSPRWPGLAALAAAFLLATACAGGGVRPVAVGGAEPWQIPRAAYGFQRLYRVSFESDRQGDGSFRLTLRLARPERYQANAVDPVGRALWGLDVTGGHGVWLDHRGRTWCRFSGGLDLAGLPLSPFPLLSLPALLLGRLPAEPAAAPQATGEAVEGGDGGRRLSYVDDRRRRWGALVAAGTVASWTLWEDGAPAVSWVRRDGWAVLSDRRQGVQVRWREILREELRGDLVALDVPAGYTEACGAPQPVD